MYNIYIYASKTNENDAKAFHWIWMFFLQPNPTFSREMFGFWSWKKLANKNPSLAPEDFILFQMIKERMTNNDVFVGCMMCCWMNCMFFHVSNSLTPITLSPTIMVQQNMAEFLKGNYYWRYTPLFTELMGGIGYFHLKKLPLFQMCCICFPYDWCASVL